MMSHTTMEVVAFLYAHCVAQFRTNDGKRDQLSHRGMFKRYLHFEGVTDQQADIQKLLEYLIETRFCF